MKCLFICEDYAVDQLFHYEKNALAIPLHVVP